MDDRDVKRLPPINLGPCATCGKEFDDRHWINGIEGPRCPECNTNLSEKKRHEEVELKVKELEVKSIADDLRVHELEFRLGSLGDDLANLLSVITSLVERVDKLGDLCAQWVAIDPVGKEATREFVTRAYFHAEIAKFTTGQLDALALEGARRADWMALALSHEGHIAKLEAALDAAGQFLVPDTARGPAYENWLDAVKKFIKARPRCEQLVDDLTEILNGGVG